MNFNDDSHMPARETTHEEVGHVATEGKRMTTRTRNGLQASHITIVGVSLMSYEPCVLSLHRRKISETGQDFLMKNCSIIMLEPITRTPRQIQNSS